MLTSYRALHVPPLELPVRNRCWLQNTSSAALRALASTRRAAPWRLVHEAKDRSKRGLWVERVVEPFGADGFPVDALASQTMEQWRERVGKLWRIPYMEHPPEELPTTDARLVLSAHADAGWEARQRPLFPAMPTAAHPTLNTPRLVACFPGAYAFGTVVGTLQEKRSRSATVGGCVPRALAHTVWTLACERLEPPDAKHDAKHDGRAVAPRVERAEHKKQKKPDAAAGSGWRWLRAAWPWGGR